MIVYIDYIKRLAKTNFVGWDIKTVTAGDYTVQINIPDQFYNKFKEKKGGRRPLD